VKIRQGFVSNSSSSSFIIAFKGKQPARAKLSAMFGIKKASVAEKMFTPIIETLMDSQEYTLEMLLEDHDVDTVEELTEVEDKDSRTCKIMKLIQDGWTVTKIDVSNEDDSPGSQFLHEGPDVEIETKSICIYHDAY
jgi:hypothetical protein